MPRTFHPVALASVAYLRYTIRNKPCQTAFWYAWNNTTPPTEPELLNLATEVYSVMVPKFQTFWHNTVQTVECYARNYDVQFAPEATYTPPAPSVGSRGGEAIAAQVALALTKRTGVTGPSRHGTMILSGFAEADVNGDVVVGNIVTGAASLATSILTDRVGGRFIPALASFKLGTRFRLTHVVLRNLLVDSSRRRTVKPH